MDETQIGPLANYIESFQEIRIDIVQQHGRVRHHRPGDDDLQVGHQPTFMAACSITTSTPWFRARNPFALARPRASAMCPAAASADPSTSRRFTTARTRRSSSSRFETSRGSATDAVAEPDGARWLRGGTAISPALSDSRSCDPPTAASLSRQPHSGRAPQRDFREDPGPLLPAAQFRRPDACWSARTTAKTRSGPRDPSTNYCTVRGDHRFSRQGLDIRPLHFPGRRATTGLRGKPCRRSGSATSSATTAPSRLLIRTRSRRRCSTNSAMGMALNNNPIVGRRSTDRSSCSDFGLIGLAPDLPDISGILNVSSGPASGRSPRSDYRRSRLPQLPAGVPGPRQLVPRHATISRSAVDGHARSSGTMVTANANLFGNLSFTNRFTGRAVRGFPARHPDHGRARVSPVAVDRLRYQYDFFFPTISK